MANQEYVELLRQDIVAWNNWKQANPTIQVDLSDADFKRINLSGADLSFANLDHANLRRSILSKSRLEHASLRHINLMGADLCGANLREANLYRAYLFGANLNGAYLQEANFHDAYLKHADLSGAFIGNTSFGNQDLREVKGLETVQHQSPSPLSINTIYLSQGDIPEAFVRGTGAPDSFLEYMKALANKPIEYYTCFISYSSKDEAFANRLYDDLQNNNVRCWFAPEDMKIGDKIRPRIDETIRMFDKLLLVLSQHSIASNWVAYEVERALDKEPQGIPNVLFPIRIDDTILTCNTQWAQDIEHTRHIGDFTHWKNHDIYQKSLDRLLRALKTPNQSKE